MVGSIFFMLTVLLRTRASYLTTHQISIITVRSILYQLSLSHVSKYTSNPTYLSSFRKLLENDDRGRPNSIYSIIFLKEILKMLIFLFYCTEIIYRW